MGRGRDLVSPSSAFRGVLSLASLLAGVSGPMLPLTSAGFMIASMLSGGDDTGPESVKQYYKLMMNELKAGGPQRWMWQSNPMVQAAGIPGLRDLSAEGTAQTLMDYAPRETTEYLRRLGFSPIKRYISSMGWTPDRKGVVPLGPSPFAGQQRWQIERIPEAMGAVEKAAVDPRRKRGFVGGSSPFVTMMSRR